MGSKLLLLIGIVLLFYRFGLRARLQRLKPRLDRSMNAALIAIAILYLGRLIALIAGRD